MPFNRGHTGLELEPSLWNSDDVRAGAAIHSVGDRHLLARTRLILQAGGFAPPAFCFVVIQDSCCRSPFNLGELPYLLIIYSWHYRGYEKCQASEFPSPVV